MRKSVPGSSGSIVERGLAFYAVGALGLGVQLATVWLLAGPVGLHYLPATAVAVELAVLHNFIWHERWTWRDRAIPPGATRRAATLGRLARFHAANGVVSIWGNVTLTGVLVAYLGTGPVIGNLLAVVACSVVNFIAADRLVFSPLPVAASIHDISGDRSVCGPGAGGR